jgi:putative ABC transport system ATP-binding protein
MITLNQVFKTYGRGDARVEALKGIDLVIEQGDFVAIIGPSGSGKSTMMNMVGCLDIPSKGEIYLENKNIAKMSESDLAVLRGKKIGFIFQQFNLIQTLSALENVSLAMNFQGISKDKRIARAKELLEFVGLGHRLKHRPSELSGGEQQRVAIARALANDPDVILADEPTGNLDSKTGEKVMGLLNDLNSKGKTIIMVTHDSSIAEHASKQVMIKDGEIAINGGRK